ncbi:metal ABC transporter permease [Candidatus Collierbacteria bacterium RIFOXYB2_FULL_46_14]|uniref:ABC-3 protein n=1 Tax=Candidatus Collierbacteria bacterium GW2011_GWA2_46_26 TaxID=1618381 RepID=A0A0G1PKB8_9BACT|nr:MAG: ABC-3 protein [Candidatus Collierbacteria bacterium GW2011_GWC2_44_13]KKU33269.1 MAG: ABC-3 protein [Candidatus Collierbacteria bacterium GW2011_GWA2_46_26]OGD72691.1 MAG: metal ABC transporter permease [Candidatus Collierbacteria bacterium RIFOXYB2_FULL_46_14]OGD75733.1 MAG: metal ABC transporter permease [Candidatus Collierbacteria bacterium RIFOXYA2_FULL_46_20]OGD77069.1 MAG: metal ABC transporter permease [Candidatus Collierbacteria bacterium RIFOXYC2_FULL_43_15]OGD80359.1 MAG: met
MLELFQYSFAIRGLVAGLIIGFIAPLIGIFLVLRRYSLIADTLAHVSLAGIAIGFLLKINPILTAIASTVLSSVVIERMRTSKKVYGESALAIFLSGSLALAVVLISLAHGFNTGLLNYLFGSIVTVKQTDLLIIGSLGALVVVVLALFYKELVYITFDEESAQVSGIPTRLINTLLIVLAALTVSLSIPIVGVLLISALMVIPVVTALQFRRSFIKTIFIAELVSLFSVVTGIFASFYLNLSTGGTIVLISLLVFAVSLGLRKR